MNAHEELLQRCFDNDLTDTEMEILFRELSINKGLRHEFKDLSLLLDDVREAFVIDQPQPNESILRSNATAPYIGGKSPVRRLITKKITVPIPIAIVIFLLTIIGSIYSVKALTPIQKPEYVYLMEMPPYVVQDYSNVHSN
ncbi:MAG: hypothetical protein WCT99_10150 [Bacteroidota bacterium]|jgi:hypothetical protein